MFTVERSDEGVSAQCEKLADISDFTFVYDLMDGQNAVEQSRSFPPFPIESSKWHDPPPVDCRLAYGFQLCGKIRFPLIVVGHTVSDYVAVAEAPTSAPPC